MSLRPVIPPADTYIPTAPATGQVIPVGDPNATLVQPPAAPAPAPVPVSNRPVVQLTGGSALALVAGGAGAVLVIGAVLVSMLLAVAITAASVAVVAVVLRSLLNQTNRES